MIPVHLISGFLGAGKTTAIIELLGRKPASEQWAIVINEFGKISIDGKTLSAKVSEHSIFEISGGCICCSAKAYFLEDMEKIIRTGRFDRIIVEPSGLGGTDHITELASQHPDLQLMPVLCLVDITMTANPRLKMLPIYKSQILKADVVLLTKSELLTNPELNDLTEKFKADFPGKKFLLKKEFDFQLSLPREARQEEKNHLTDLRPWNIVDRHSCRELCLALPSGKKIDMQKLKEILEEEKSILRAKGYIYDGNQWLLFNFTLSGLITEVCRTRESNELAIIFDATDNALINSFGKKIEALFGNA